MQQTRSGLQHDFAELIVSTLHVDFDHQDCWRQLRLREMASAIKKLNGRRTATGCSVAPVPQDRMALFPRQPHATAGGGGCLPVASESEFTPAKLAMFYEFTIITALRVLKITSIYNNEYYISNSISIFYGKWQFIFLDHMQGRGRFFRRRWRTTLTRTTRYVSSKCLSMVSTCGRAKRSSKFTGDELGGTETEAPVRIGVRHEGDDHVARSNLAVLFKLPAKFPVEC